MEDTSGPWVVGGMIFGFIAYMLGRISYEENWLSKARQCLQRHRRRGKNAVRVGDNYTDPYGVLFVVDQITKGGTIILKRCTTGGYFAANAKLLEDWYTRTPDSGV